MSKFEVGESVWVSRKDCYGYIVDVDEDSYVVEVEITMAIEVAEDELEAVE